MSDTDGCIHRSGHDLELSLSGLGWLLSDTEVVEKKSVVHYNPGHIVFIRCHIILIFKVGLKFANH